MHPNTQKQQDVASRLTLSKSEETQQQILVPQQDTTQQSNTFQTGLDASVQSFVPASGMLPKVTHSDQDLRNVNLAQRQLQ